jgi:hypothetical protein
VDLGLSGNRSLLGLNIPGSFRRFLQVPDAGADGTLRDVCDGEGDALPLRISTTAVEVTAAPTTPNGVVRRADLDAALATPAYELWLILGQSNAQGRGTMDALIETPNPRLWQFGATPSATEANGRYQTIFSGSDPLYHPQGIIEQTGAASTFARLRLDSLPSARRVLLVPLAWGGTSLVVPPARWGVSGPGDLLANAVTQANAALAAARAVYPASYIKGFIWQQGEADGNTVQATYAAAQDGMLSYLRANITGASEALFLVAGMTPERIALGGAGVAAAQRETPARSLRSAYVDCPAGYTVSGDPLHASVRPGPQIIGERLNGALPYAEANVSGALPLAPGAITFSAVGNDTFTATVVAPLSRVTNYVWEYRTLGGLWASITPSPASSYPQRVFTGLARNTAYEVRVSAINEVGQGPESPIATQATTDAPTLATFAAPAVSSVTNTTASVSAVQISGDAATTVYAWYRTAETAAAPAGTWVSAASGGAFPLSVTGLVAGTAYDFAASGDNAAGTGPRGALNTVSTTGTVAAPDAPTDVQASIIATGQAFITWRVPATGGRPTTTTVEYSDNGGSSWQALPTGSNVGVEQANVIGLPSDKTVYFQVQLSNTSGSSAFVSSGAIYWLEAMEIMAALALEGDTLTTTQQDAINSFVSATKADATWDRIGAMYVGFVGTANAALVDWKAPNGARWTSNGTPGFTADRGHVGDSSTAWLGSGRNWNALPGVTQNSAHVAVLATATGTNATLAGTTAGGATRIAKASNVFASQINSSASAAVDAWGTGSTLALINRTVSAGYDRTLNGAAATAAVAVSGAAQTSPFILLRSGASYAPNTATLHAVTAGAGLTAGQVVTLNAELRTLANAFGVP